MADSVKLRIESGFDATGMLAAQQSMRKTQEAAKSIGDSGNAAMRGLKAGSAGAAALSGALGSGSGGVAASARAASGALAAFSAGGPWAAALAIGVSVVASLVDKFQQAKQSAEEFSKKSKEAFQARLVEIQQKRVSQLSESYESLTKRINAARESSERLNQASARNYSAEINSKVALLQAERDSKIGAADSPEIAEKIRLEFARKIAEVELDSAVVAAQYRENSARRQLDSQQRISAAQVEQERKLMSLRGITRDSKARDSIDDQLRKLREDMFSQGSTTASAELDLATAVEEVKTARIRQAAGLSEAVRAQEKLLEIEQKALSSKLEASAVESELASLKQDEAAIQREANAAAARRAAAEQKAAAAANQRVNDWVEKQRGANAAKKAAAEEEMRFRQDVDKIKDKQARGIRISRRDQETIDLLEQRRRILEAGAPKKAPELTQLEKIAESVRTLEQIRDDLKKSLTTG